MKKIIGLTVLLVLLAGMGAAATDGFEDGDFTSNPAWNVNSSGAAEQVQQTTVKNGNDALQLSTNGGGDSILAHKNTDTVFDGAIYQTWIRTDNVGNQLQYGINDQTSGAVTSGNSTGIRILSGGTVNFFARQSNSSLFNTDLYNSFSANTWYLLEIEFGADDVTGRIYDDSNTLLGSGTLDLTDNSNTLRFVRMANLDFSNKDVFYDDVTYNVAPNNPPTINSNATEPTNPTLNDDINVTANVTDPDGDAIANVSATVLEDGVQIADVPMPATTGDLFKAVDAFTADEANVWYNITITAEDSNGATSTSEITFRIEDNAPSITINDPESKTYNSAPPYTVLFNDTDDVTGETFDWALWRNGTQLDSGSDTENFTQSGTITGSTQGLNNFTANATDPQGNTATESVTYTFDDVGPVVNITDPVGNITVDDARNVDLNFTVSDATSSVNGCVINPNNGTGNFTQATCQNTTLTYTSNGDQTVEIWANDTANNTAYAFSDFNIRIENLLKANDSETGLDINSFSAAFSNGTAAFDTTLSTTNGELTPLTRNLPTGSAVDVDVSATGYNDVSTTIDINGTLAFNETVTLSPVSVSYEVFDESTQDYIDNPAIVRVQNGTHEESYGVLNKFKDSQDTDSPAAAFDRNLNTFADVNNDASGTGWVEGYVALKQVSNNSLFVKGQTDSAPANIPVEAWNEDTQTWDVIDADVFNATVFTYRLSVNNSDGRYDSGRIRVGAASGEGSNVYEVYSDHLTTVSVPTDDVLFGNTTIRVNDIDELDEYRPRTFFAEITDTDRNIHTYLLKRSDGITASVKTEDELEQAISNARVTLTREFGFDTAVIAQRETASGGTATFFVDPDEVYGLNASKTGFETFSGTFNGQPYQFNPFVVTLQSLDTTTLEDSLIEIRAAVTHECTLFNTTYFNCTYSHSKSNIESVNLSVDRLMPVQNQNVCQLGSGLGSNELVCSGLNVTNTTYSYVLFASLTDGNQVTLESGTLESIVDDYGNFGLFAFLVLLIPLVLGSLWLPEVTIVVAALTVPLAFFTGVLAVSVESVTGLIAVALILLWRLTR